MDKGFVWQGDYGKRTHLVPIFSRMLDMQDATSLSMLAVFVNNNPYNLEFFVVVNYEKAEKNHIEEMVTTFENAGLVYRSDLTMLEFFTQMGSRRFNATTFLNSKSVEMSFSEMFYFCEKEEMEKKGYFMRPFGKDKQIFISHSSKDKEEVKKLIPYLNGMELPVWFDEYNIAVGQSITEKVQEGIDQSEKVIFWVTKNFLESAWCKTEMNAFIKKMIEENNLIFLVLDDGIEIKELPLFLRDIKFIRRERRSVYELAELLTSEIKAAINRWRIR